MKCKSYFIPVVSEFFSEYLPKTKGLSVNTIRSYKYAFRLFLEYVLVKYNLAPEKIEFCHLKKGIVENWLKWLCADRGCSAKTRNNRLEAFVTFARFALYRNFIDALPFCSEIEYLPKKKHTERPQAVYYGRRCLFFYVCLVHTPK